MPTTRDYKLLGKTTWRAEIFLDDGDDAQARHLDSAEYPNPGLAQAWVNRKLAQFYREDGQPWAELRRGTYLDESFETPEDGHVDHASWESDGRTHRFAYLAEDGLTVDWLDDSQS